MMNYVLYASMLKAKDIHLDENAVMYTQWLILPASAKIGWRLAQKILKTAKYEVRKAARKVAKECNQIDIMMAGDNKEEILDIYDNMLKDFRKEMEVEEENILECCKDYYNNDILAETLFAYAITKLHRAFVYQSSLSLKKGKSMLNVDGSLKYITILLDSIAELGRALEKKDGITSTVFSKHTEEDKDTEIVGLRDVIGDYSYKLLNDVEMHQRIQTPFAEHQKKMDAEAEKLGNDILEQPISVLEIETDFFERHGITLIKDLYGESGLKDFDWNDDEKKNISAALRNYIIKRVYV